MLKLSFLFLTKIFIPLFSVLATGEIEITLSHGGILIGTYQETVKGAKIRSFLGIPYAKAPVEELRFTAPVPYGSWNGKKQAKIYGNICPQKLHIVQGSPASGEEDCLFVNVHVPDDIPPNSQNLSVMVFIYGGAWMIGASNYYGPERLLDHNVILVTFNYRLGILGFLSTGTIDCPGNNGLKDQALALKWVQDNIAAFGGNPNDITIFGESAGGASVNNLMYSPLAVGLFHRAIIQSGTIYDPWSYYSQDRVHSYARKVAKLLGCDMVDANWKDAIQCLRKVPATNFLDIVPNFLDSDMEPLATFPPVIEIDNPEAFITKNLKKETTSEKASSIPVLIGVTRDEGAMRSARLLNLPDNEFRNKWEDMLPIILAYDHHPDSVKKEITTQIDKFYFQGKHDWDITNHQNLTNLISDRWFLSGLDKFLQKRFTNPQASTYVYLFDQNATLQVTQMLFGYTDYYVILNSALSDVELPKVTLSHGGNVVGGHMTTVSGKGILAFRGIPYAEPPVGNLRFEPPQPVKPWKGEKLTYEDPSICIQINPYERNFTVVGSEDCLYLNVYAPQGSTSSSALPVMVYIHGGGWVAGTGNSKANGPQRLLDHDIILVIGNYRLGALGFLSTGTVDCPGNNGFKDQLLMLKWVRDNIANFGGDPKQVAIFGESAGSVSVGYHMYSEVSKGLFNKAIMQSGSIYNGWAMIDPLVASYRAAKLGNILNCTYTESDWAEMIGCLKVKPASDIVLSLKEYFEFDIDPVIAFAGVPEVNHPGAFITKFPKDIASPPSMDIPIIIGGTADEGAIKSGSILNLLKDEFTQNFSEIFSIISGYKKKPLEVRKEILKRIDGFYFKNGHNWSKQNHQNLTDLFSDQRFNIGQDKYLRKRFDAGKKTKIGATYVYLFDQKGPKSATEIFHGGPEYYGVCHTDDLPYIFYNEFSALKGNEYDQQMKMALPEMWANFAKTGNPTPEGSSLPTWIPATNFPVQYAHLGSKLTDNWRLLTNEIGLLEDRIQFWRDLNKDFNL